MCQYKIISDSSCDLPEALIKKLDIDFVPYYVTFDQVEYFKEKVELAPEKFYDIMIKEKLFPKTSLPPIQDYIDVFEKHLKEKKDIVCMCLSSKFSGSFQSATNAKNMLLEEYPNRRIEIVDTIQATGGQGLVVYEACQMQQAGYSIDEMLQTLEGVKKTAKINFTVDSLEHLQKGGRIGKASALAGSLLNIKPIIIMKNGELIPESKVRGKKKAVQTILQMTLQEIADDTDSYDVILITANRFDDIHLIKEVLQEKNIYFIDNPWIIGATIGTHAGPTAIGICYIKKYTCFQ